VAQDGRLLLVRRAREPYLGFWDIPGGFLEVDELPSEGAVREVEEETGLKVRATALFGFYRDIYCYKDEENHCLNIYFLGRVVEGTEELGNETTDLGWFAPEDLPQAIAFDHARRVLDDWTEWMRNRGRRSRT
jgi:ADP-ribose pyrophosphatase YjhB (NUDIX family)